MAAIQQTYHHCSDFVAYAGSKAAPSYNEFISSLYEGADWYGVSEEANRNETSGETVLKLVSKGWPRGVELMTEVNASTSVPVARSVRRRMRWHDQGDDINMQRVYAGNLETAWQTTTRQLSNGPMRVRIVVDSLSMGVLESEKMRWKGIAAMRLTDILTEAGYTVQVESAFYGRGGHSHPKGSGERTLRIIVKAYSDPLDLGQLAATAALPGFFRALGHSWAGGSMQVEDLKPRHVSDDGDKAPVFIVPQAVQSSKDATAWVNKALLELQPETN